MPDKSEVSYGRTYENPVYPHSFPDPFVLKFRGEYFAYCTGLWHDGKVFGVLRSRDLVHWTEVGGAMQRLDNDAPFYWAPEVSYHNGKFYLYYSVGNEVLMELRVAVSDRPDGAFVDSGHRLTNEEFAIDAHVFTAQDGQRYMFYATDFLTHTHIGTGTVVDRMVDWFELEGQPRPVTRAKYDWQVYDPARKEKGGVRWHTVEGPFVLERKGVYYEMFSGGNWQNTTYGVSFAVSRNVIQDEEWEQFADGDKVLPILRTIPDLVVGPGHNSVVRGPNNRELYCVYHCWTDEGRVLAIDRMDFAGHRIFVDGPTHTPAIHPYQPAVVDHFDGVAANWSIDSEWSIGSGEAVSGPTGENRLVCTREAPCFLSEVSFRGGDSPTKNGSFGIRVDDVAGTVLEFLIYPERNVAVISGPDGHTEVQLEQGFDASAYHHSKIDVDAAAVKVWLDGVAIADIRPGAKGRARIALVSNNSSARFSGFSLTEGFEDLFEHGGENAESGGWRANESGTCRVENGQLLVYPAEGGECVVSKGDPHEEYEFAANIRLVGSDDQHAEWGLAVLDNDDEVAQRFQIRHESGRYVVAAEPESESLLPESFLPGNHHQFRVLQLGGKISLKLEDIHLVTVPVLAGVTRIGLFSRNAVLAVEMARLTVL